MSTEYGHKIKPAKGDKIVEAAASELVPGEEIIFLAKCNNLRPPCTHVVVTNLRIAGLAGDGKFKVEFPYAAGASIDADAKRETLTVRDDNSNEMVFKMVQREDHEKIESAVRRASTSSAPPEAEAAYREVQDSAASQAHRLEQAKTSTWPNTRVVGGKLSSKASQAVLRQCGTAEDPWLILVSSGGAGVLTAFDDRLAIVKTGGLTSLMAGSLGGERSATFHFRDITGIEYNSGFVNGVLEILTPSYSGSANKDFWRGSSKSRNADSNDPWTLSNCLPLTKAEYNASQSELIELKARISKAKEIVVNVGASETTTPSMADELKKLSDLLAAGVLTDEEFTAAKRRILDGS